MQEDSSRNSKLLPPPVHPTLRRQGAPPLAVYRESIAPHHRAVPPPPLAPRPPVIKEETPQPVDEVQPIDPKIQYETMPGSIDPNQSQFVPQPQPEKPPVVEEELSEVQLRELYDDEEINRFLHLFSAYVDEVRADSSGQVKIQPSNSNGEEREEHDNDDSPEDSEHDWVALDKEEVQSPISSSFQLDSQNNSTLCEWAASYILRYLPPRQPPPPQFSIKRLRLVSQRAYLAAVPIYYPLLIRLLDLATWKDTRVSLVCCLAYWFLWYNGLLLAAFLTRVLYALIRRRFLPYPSLDELRKHRADVERAENLSASISSRMSVSTFGVRDVIALIRETKKKPSKGKEKVESRVRFEGDTDTVVGETLTTELGDNTALTTMALFAANQLLDIHERAKNLFLWRMPAASAWFGFLIFFGILVSLLPAVFLARIGGLIAGIVFWHVIPVMAVIPVEDLSRFSAACRVVPTDAEYAMELISQRVARGLDVKPKPRRKTSESSLNDTPGGVETTSRGSVADISVDWKKWGQRAAHTKSWTKDVKSIFKDGQWKDPTNWPTRNPLTAKVVIPSGGSQPVLEAHTYPAHNKTPGLITLTSSALIFSPIASSQTKLSIGLENIIGVKKMGTVHGLRIRWTDALENGVMVERDEKFFWVGGRDELFARIVGSQGRRWTKV
ncbi:GRAM domain-containing protein 4 [Abortiporus biennis]